MPKARLQFIDYAKALCIIGVVCIHVGISWVNYLGYILMALFFFSSGYTGHYERRSVAQNAKNLFKKVMVPYFVAALLYGVCEIFRAKYLGYGDASIFLPAVVGMLYGSLHKVPPIPGLDDTLRGIMSYKPGGGEFVDVILPLNCHLWFLPALFTGAMLFVLYLKTVGKTRKPVADIVAIVVLLILAYVESLGSVPQYPYALGRGCFCCACMIAGRVFREHEVLERLEANRARLIVGVLVLFVIEFAAWMLAGDDKSMASMARSNYGPCGVFGPAIVLVGGVSATMLIYMAMKALSEKHPSKVLSYIGQHTMAIYLWHMFFLNVISILLLLVTRVEVAQDVWYMAIIPQDQTGLILLATVLTFVCCLGVVPLKDRLVSVAHTHRL